MFFTIAIPTFNRKEILEISLKKIFDSIKNIEDKIEITLSDIAGREVFQEAFTSSHSINTEQLAKGTYLYELRSKNGIIKIGKVVKD